MKHKYFLLFLLYIASLYVSLLTSVQASEAKLIYLGKKIYKYQVIYKKPKQNVVLRRKINQEQEISVDITGSLVINDQGAVYSYYKNDYSEPLQIQYSFLAVDKQTEETPWQNHTTGSGGFSHRFETSFPTAMVYVELMIERNQETHANYIITDSEYAMAEGNYRYHRVLDQFSPEDEATYRIYARDAEGNEWFTPGPDALARTTITFDEQAPLPHINGQSILTAYQDVFFPLNAANFEFSKPLQTHQRFTLLPGDGYELTNEGIIPTDSKDILVNIELSQLEPEPMSETFQALVKVSVLDQNALLFAHDFEFFKEFDVSVISVMDALAAQSSDPGLSGAKLFRQLLDTQSDAANSELLDNQHCDDASSSSGRNTINAYPYDCPRFEGSFVQGGLDTVLAEMRSYRPAGIINRLDLIKGNYDDCGEQRLIFNRSNPFGNNQPGGQLDIIFEARLPNPTPGNPDGCRPLVDFWTQMMQEEDITKQADIAHKLWFTGYKDFPPILSIEHFFKNTGQIRTNQNASNLINKAWTFREYTLKASCKKGLCNELFAMPSPIKDTFFAPLFNGHLPHDITSEYADRSARFQQEFLENINSLFTNNMADLAVSGSLEFTHSDGHILNSRNSRFDEVNESNYVFHFEEGQKMGPSEFESVLETSIAGKLDASGNQLSITQVLNRAKTQTCAGCHFPQGQGLTIEGALGDMLMPDGSISSIWPRAFSFTFTHFSGGSNSQAFSVLFKPARFQKMKQLMSEIARRNN